MILLRKATRDDVAAIVQLFANDMLGSRRESQEEHIPECYYEAFAAIDTDKNNCLIVAEDNGKVVGTLQLTFIVNMSFYGAKRALIEGVHVASDYRNQGIGQHMMQWAIDAANKQGCRFVQLTSNKLRKDAHRFYQRLGFADSHEGFKMELRKE